MLDSVIVGGLNHDLRAKKIITLGLGEMFERGLYQDFRMKKKIGDNVWNE
jgi:hypothetical protein